MLTNGVFSALAGHAQYVIIDKDLQSDPQIVEVDVRDEQWVNIVFHRCMAHAIEIIVEISLLSYP
jgi:hypothetical protein